MLLKTRLPCRRKEMQKWNRGGCWDKIRSISMNKFLNIYFLGLSTELAQKLVTGLGKEKSKLFVPEDKEAFKTDGDVKISQEPA